MSSSRRIPLATGLTYHVLEWNREAASDTTYVLVHGFLDLAFGWHEVAPLLAASGAHVLAPDLRGHGDSDWIGPGGYYHFMDYVADLDDVIARLARKRVIVAGHSMGGSVASYWAGTRPDRLVALALLEGLGPPDQSEIDPSGRTKLWIDAWKAARVKPMRTMASLEEAAARLRKNDPLLDLELARRLAAAGTRAVEVGLVWKHDPLHTTMGPYPFRRDYAAQMWRKISCPVLAIDGARSLLNLGAPERASRRAEFARCRHAVIDGAGHMLQRHQPAALARLLVDLAATP